MPEIPSSSNSSSSPAISDLSPVVLVVGEWGQPMEESPATHSSILEGEEANEAISAALTALFGAFPSGYLASQEHGGKIILSLSSGSGNGRTAMARGDIETTLTTAACCASTSSAIASTGQGGGTTVDPVAAAVAAAAAAAAAAASAAAAAASAAAAAAAMLGKKA